MARPLVQGLTALLLGSLSFSLVSEEGAETSAASVPTLTDGGQMASRVYRDPETGELGAPPEHIPRQVDAPDSALSAATRQRLSRSGEGLQAQTRPDGTVTMNLQGRFQSASVLTLDSQGEQRLSCSHSAEDVEHTLSHGAHVDAAAPGSAP